MRDRRPGFTIIELLTVIIIVGMMTVFAIPRATEWRERSRVTAARQTVSSSIATARAAAIQKGYRGWFAIDNDVVRVEVDTAPPGNATALVVVREVNLKEEYGTTLRFGPAQATTFRIEFDPRGFAKRGSLPDPANIFYLVSGARRDSVCVAPMGQILPQGCEL